MNENAEKDEQGKWEQLCAIFKYEFLWNVRKKKVLAMFLVSLVLASLGLFLPSIVGDKGSDPYFIVENMGPSGFIVVLLAVAIAMRSISGEFEAGTIEPLASKPVSRKIIYSGKLLAMFVILLIVYTVLDVYFIAGGWLLYGSQKGLNLVLLLLPFMAALSSFVWLSISLVLGAWTKNSILAGLGVIGLFFGISIASGIISVTSPGAGKVLNYVPGGGESGEIQGRFGENIPVGNSSISTGTDRIASNLLLYSNFQSTQVIVREYKLDLENIEAGGVKEIGFHSDPLSKVLLRSISVALIYVTVFNLLAWQLFERTEIEKT